MLHNKSHLPPTWLSDNTIKEIDNFECEFTCKWNASVNCKIFISDAFKKRPPRFSCIMNMQTLSKEYSISLYRNRQLFAFNRNVYFAGRSRHSLWTVVNPDITKLTLIKIRVEKNRLMKINQPDAFFLDISWLS